MRRTRIFAIASVFLALIILIITQIPSSGMTPSKAQVYGTTLHVHFEQDSLHGFHGSVFQQKSFSVKLSLGNNTDYIAAFENSDFNVEELNISDPDNHKIYVNSDFSFESTSQGVYIFSVSGYYLYDRPADSSGAHRELDDTVDFNVYEITVIPVRREAYVYLWPLIPLLLVVGVCSLVLSSRKVRISVH